MKPNPKPPVTSASALCLEEQSLLSTAVTNSETGSIVQVRLILDSGSHRSYVTERLSKQLGLVPQQSDTLQVAVFGTERTLLVTSSQVRLRISLRGGKSILLTAHTTPMITSCSLAPHRLPEATQQLVNSMRDEMADDFGKDHGPPDILIGSDYFWEFITGSRTQTTDGIYFIPSSLGIMLGGRFSDCESDGSSCEYPSLLCLTERTALPMAETGLCALSSDSKARQQYPDIDEFWALETIGIADNPLENDDDMALQQFNETICMKDGRYHVQWPWKNNKTQLPTNYQLALGRLRSLAKRLSAADETVRNEYSKVIEEQLALGIIEQVPSGDRSGSTTIHYLPHHPVVRSCHGTTKLRIVYDASAKCRKDQVSLNECLYRGPVILPDLCAILIRFRLNNIALVADIEKAFLQICLQSSERNATRFLWFRDPKNPDADDAVILRFARVPFGVVSSPFILAAVVQHHLKRVKTSAAKQIENNIYVDNVITGVANEGVARAFYTEAKEMFKEAGFNLREWCTNSNTVFATIPEVDRTANRVVKVLGLRWNSEADVLQLQNNWTTRVKCQTKREVLQATASIYDPLGLFQPCTQKAKCFLRDLWNANSGWDDVIDEDLQHKWNYIHRDIEPIFSIPIPRNILQPHGDINETTLVVFCDASIDTYAAAVYLRSPWVSRGFSATWESNLVYAKSRLTPRQKSSADISLPRLELLGMTIAARAVEFVRKSLSRPIAPKAYIMTDSSCVMGWLRSDKPLPKFVANRVRLIRQLSNVEFHHVCSGDNAADVVTRGLSGREIKESTLWWKGPQWLREDSMQWPTKSIVDVITDTTLNDIRQASGQPIFHSLFAGEGRADRQPLIKNYPFNITPKSYSTFRKLLRVTAWCLKFIKKFLWSKLSAGTHASKPVLHQLLGPEPAEEFLTATEVSTARWLWIKSVQNNQFGNLLTSLREGKSHPLTRQLNVGIDDNGVLRCYGRLTHAELPSDAITPVLLPKSDDITNLIIKELHERLLHAGIGHTLSQMRRQFWVPQGRNVVRKVITRCTLCRRLKGPPFAMPNMPPWPRERLSKSVPFQFSGLDYLGPVNVSIHGNTQKMWICIFTCLAVRAIHLEHVYDCSAQCFIDCLSRFIARRGAPEQIISDNAPQFRLAKTLFDRTWHLTLADPSVQSYISDKGVTWKFTTELAPWQGGFYERLVGLVKNTLRAAVGRRLLPWDHFVTLIAEAEAIINSRPITYVHSDIRSGLALRPMDFLADLPTGTPDVDPLTPLQGGEAGRNLMKYWKSKQRRLRLLWQQWHDDYLLSMRERGMVSHKRGRSDVWSSPILNEVVLVKNADAPRGSWKLGRISRVIAGNDGSVRSAEVTLPNGYVIRRSVSHLYRLEIPTVDDTEHVDNGAEPPDQQHSMDELAVPTDGEKQHDTTASVSMADHNVGEADGSTATSNSLWDDTEPFDGFSEEEVAGAEELVRQLRHQEDITMFAAHSQRNIWNSLTEAAVTVTFGLVAPQQ